jgi:uncharacterized protein (TIGR03067 family)
MTTILFVLAFVATGEEKKDRDLIQGTWKVTRLEYGGRINTEHFREDTWIFKGDQLTLIGDGKVFYKMTFKLDPTKQPKTIDLTITEGDSDVGRTDLGIYRLAENTLTLSRSLSERPKEFAGAGKRGRPGLITLERVKAK